jgi:hypothetical protein
MKTILYKRNGKGQPIQWGIELKYDRINIFYGLVGGNIHKEELRTNRDCKAEYNSLITFKKKEGYKELSETWDNAPDELGVEKRLIKYLNAYLPKNNTTNTGFTLPMLAKVLEADKFEASYAQWKINGLRCLIGYKKVGEGLFQQDSLQFRSREGGEFNIPYLESYLMTYLPKAFYKLMKEEDYWLDGELYIPGIDLNEINSAAKNIKNPLNSRLQYWCYDIAVDGCTYDCRLDLKREHFNKFIIKLPGSLKDIHYNNTNRLVLLPDKYVPIYEFAYKEMLEYVDAGFEGLIARHPSRDYQFGKRNTAMFKLKPLYDGKFKIIDIIPEGIKRSEFAKFVLENDINSEQFEMIPIGSFDTKRMYLLNKEHYIGKNAFVQYRTRGGVTNVPMHGNVTSIELF